ncbi:MAG: protein kinase [Acidobacteria bacterium]|nr:protein kinase [Acidobacteriota bacterium]
MKKIGRYEIQGELGRGAMGVVYAATDPLIGRQVAIKTIRLGALDAGANHAELTERLHREARAAGVLSHPGILTIHDVGEQGEEAYIVMEFIDGRTLEEMLASGVPQRSGMLLSILRKAAESLDYAHSKGIIHRDIKPSNIMISTEGAVKIADFGVAKLTASTSMTQSGFVLGTPSYMSPEQAQGRAIDGRSDQFSLAVVAYRMLTGRLPFEGPTLTALLAKILWEDPEYENAGLKLPIRPIFERALAKDPLLRFPNCAEFVRELEETYARSKAEAIDAAPFMTGHITASAGPKATSPAPASRDETAPALEAPGSTPNSEAATAHTPAPPPAQVDKGVLYSLSPASPENSGRAIKKKSSLTVWIFSLGAVVLAVAAFFVIKVLLKPGPPVQETPAPAASILKTDAARVAAPSETDETVPEQEKKNRTEFSQPETVQPVPAKAVAPESTQPKPKPPEAAVSPIPHESGVLTWTGNLEKNSILVIADRNATVGNVAGKLPGKPVHIEVEPKGLAIRQMPSEINSWDQIILYSGNQKYTSITIRWQLIK